MTEPFKTTDEGYLKGRACITNIGVFPYRMSDGRIEWELRHPEDVFNLESMDSFKLKPLTNDHPPVFVDSTNIKDYQVGNLGENPINGDNIHLTIDMIIQDKTTIDDVVNGKRELSCGYSCDVVDEAGVWLGVQYTKRQKNIRGNHVAVVDAARAGEAARIRLDSADAIMVSTAENAVLDNLDKEATMPELKKIVLDSIEYEAEESVIRALKTACDRADTAEKGVADAGVAMEAIKAERDTYRGKADALEQELVAVKASKADEDAIKAGVDKRLKLIDAAMKAAITLKGDETNVDIQKAVILSAFPDSKLNDASDVYLAGMFDGALAFLSAKNDASVRVVGLAEVHSDSTDKVATADAAYRARLAAQGRS
jgi:hypothetical protein